MSQQDKVFLNMAGEFAVASELNRRRVLASVTYGSSKSADIFAMNPEMTKTVRIEVKTTDKQKWPIGEKATRAESQSSDVFWVLVHLPTPHEGALDEALRGAHAPRFFMLSALEIYEAWRMEADVYLEAYRARHGRNFDKVGVPNVTLRGVLDAEGKWGKIMSRLNQRRA